MDPQEPSQPSIDTSYKHPSNPSDQDPAEQASAQSTDASISRSDPNVDSRKAGDVASGAAGQEEATPSSLAMGGQGEGDKEVKPPPHLLQITISQHTMFDMKRDWSLPTQNTLDRRIPSLRPFRRATSRRWRRRHSKNARNEDRLRRAKRSGFRYGP